MNQELLRNIFYSSLRLFLEKESENISSGVSERNLCAKLAVIIEMNAHKEGISKNYVADVEYNRKQNGEIKTIIDQNEKIIPITCDLILHSRGKMGEHDNLIAVEMKKKGGNSKSIKDDKLRLLLLTKKSFDDVWGWNGTDPEHVCGYKIGFFLQLDKESKTCTVFEYASGTEQGYKTIKFY